MADITDIKSILHTDKTLKMQDNNIITVETNNRVSKSSLKHIFINDLKIVPIKINSMKIIGKVKKFKGRLGKRIDRKKFYVKVPSGSKISGLGV